MMKSVIKFMTKEELVTMLVQIRNWRNPNTGKYLKKFKTCEEHWADEYNIAKFKFNMNNLDFADVLICGEGYVRYYYRKKKLNKNHPAYMLVKRFGFVEE